MAQFNLNLTPQFEKDLITYMKKKGLANKSEAIREAIHEAVERLKNKRKATDWDSLLGMALKYPLNPNPRFKSDDELWDEPELKRGR